MPAETSPPAQTSQLLGWTVVTLASDELEVQVIPGLGGTVTSIRRRRDDTELLWQAPWGLRPAGALAPTGDARAQRWQTDPGGWRSIFPNAGDVTTMHNTEWGYDGEVRTAFFSHELADNGALIMTTRLVRAPFAVTKIIRVEGGTVSLTETVRNVGATAMEVIWASQLSFGPPLLGPDTVVDSTAGFVHPDPSVAMDARYADLTPWPRGHGAKSMINLRTLPGPDADERRLVYLEELEGTALSVENRGLGVRVELAWDQQEWPYAIYELEAGFTAGFPFWDRGYLLTLQPSSSWPAKGIYDARRLSGSTVWIEADASRTSQLSLTVVDLG